MLAEAWGKFTGGLNTSEISASAKLKESQIAFHVAGHFHDGTTGASLTSASIRKKHLNVASLKTLWGNLYYDDVLGSNIYIVLAGHGTCTLATSATAVWPNGTRTFYYGLVEIDYNPYDTTWPTTAACQLDIRDLAAYYSSSPFNSNWTPLGAVAVPVYAGAIDLLVKRIAYGGANTTTGPNLYFLAETTGSGTVNFDYHVVLRKL
jgi:hypothetical protein